eukprot:1079337-Prymnesium_polylepis.1
MLNRHALRMFVHIKFVNPCTTKNLVQTYAAAELEGGCVSVHHVCPQTSDSGEKVTCGVTGQVASPRPTKQASPDVFLEKSVGFGTNTIDTPPALAQIYIPHDLTDRVYVPEAPRRRWTATRRALGATAHARVEPQRAKAERGRGRAAESQPVTAHFSEVCVPASCRPHARAS